jgi:hypothetical protein
MAVREVDRQVSAISRRSEFFSIAAVQPGPFSIPAIQSAPPDLYA